MGGRMNEISTVVPLPLDIQIWLPRESVKEPTSPENKGLDASSLSEMTGGAQHQLELKQADNLRRYAAQVLETACHNIESASDGERHSKRLRESRLIGGYVSARLLDETNALERLRASASANTNDELKALKTISDGFEDGKRQPVDVSSITEHWERKANAPNQEEPLIQGNFHWMTTKSKEQVMVANLHNVHEILKVRKFPVWFDQFTGKKLSTFWPGGDVKEWEDHHTLQVTRLIQDKYEDLRRIGRDLVDQAVDLFARNHPRNQLTDWLSSLRWDGEPRLDTWLIVYCGVQDSVFAQEAGRCWLLGAVARAFCPGTQFDHCIVLEGTQGIGKSSLLKTLSNGWFQELEDFSGKDSAEVLMGTWIVEISELSALKKSDMESVKRFLTTTVDRYRPPYGRHVVDRPRTCVFAGTTNQNEYLQDPSGNRRFWPIHCGEIKRDAFKRDRDQLLAEAVIRYHQGESFLMTSEAQQVARQQQEFRCQTDSWIDRIADFVATRQLVSMEEILTEALQIREPGQWKRSDEMRVGAIMQKLGWVKGRLQQGGKRGSAYRRQEQ